MGRISTAATRVSHWLARGAEIRRSFVFGLRYSWRVNRLRTTALVVVPIVESLFPAALALILRGLVNAALAGSQAAPADGWSIETYVAISLALTVGLAVAQSAMLFLGQDNSEALEHRMAVDLLEHADTLAYARFEDPAFQDMSDQVRNAPGHHVHQLVTKCVRTFALLLMLSSLLVVLARIEPFLLLYLVPLALPYLAYRSWVARQRFLIQMGQRRAQRWIIYFTGQVMRNESLPEVRALDLGPLFRRRVTEHLSTIRAEDHRSFRHEFLGSSAFNSLAVFAIHLALLQAANNVASGSLTVGDIAVFAGAATALRGSVDAFVMGIGSMRFHLSHLENLREFFAIPADPARTSSQFAAPAAAAAAPTATTALPLVVADLAFRYPGTARPILDGLSLTIEAGETVGLVGRNGSGKSTLVKLLTGLYPPDRGSIAVAGLDTEGASIAFLRANISTVFQHYGRYNASAAENIAMGDWRELLGDRRRIEEIAERTGLTELIESLPESYDTPLGREFGVQSLSGGQWQTFAIARAFARETPLMVLDEPTSNLDPEAEFEVFEHFKELAQGRATLLISHRFTTLALADRIVVLEGGRAEEQGTHDELVALGGTYAHLHQLFRERGETGVWRT